MINKHIVNIGYPRCGTTWLWECSEFEPRHDKENKLLIEDLNFDQYVKYYSQYRISANFQPNLWHVDTEIIKFVQQHASHITLIVRNPFDFVERFIDFIHPDQAPTENLINYVVYSGYIKYRDVAVRWGSSTKPFQIFYFDDLEQDPFTFFTEYMTFCQIPIAKNLNIDYNLKVNANPRKEKIKINFTRDQIDFVNHEIDLFQSVVDRNLTHWKK